MKMNANEEKVITKDGICISNVAMVVTAIKNTEATL